MIRQRSAITPFNIKNEKQQCQWQCQHQTTFCQAAIQHVYLLYGPDEDKLLI